MPPADPGQTVLWSFGYRHGPSPFLADIVIDARSLYDPLGSELRARTGLDPAVAIYVLGTPAGRRLLTAIANATRGLRGGTAAVGCAGGQHRSVALVEAAALALRTEYRGDVQVIHRDIELPVLEPDSDRVVW